MKEWGNCFFYVSDSKFSFKLRMYLVLRLSLAFISLFYFFVPGLSFNPPQIFGKLMLNLFLCFVFIQLSCLYIRSFCMCDSIVIKINTQDIWSMGFFFPSRIFATLMDMELWIELSCWDIIDYRRSTNLSKAGTLCPLLQQPQDMRCWSDFYNQFTRAGGINPVHSLILSLPPSLSVSFSLPLQVTPPSPSLQHPAYSWMNNSAANVVKGGVNKSIA